jgi:hypothetical protein
METPYQWFIHTSVKESQTAVELEVYEGEFAAPVDDETSELMLADINPDLDFDDVYQVSSFQAPPRKNKILVRSKGENVDEENKNDTYFCFPKLIGSVNGTRWNIRIVALLTCRVWQSYVVVHFDAILLKSENDFIPLIGTGGRFYVYLHNIVQYLQEAKYIDPPVVHGFSDDVKAYYNKFDEMKVRDKDMVKAIKQVSMTTTYVTRVKNGKSGKGTLKDKYNASLDDVFVVHPSTIPKSSFEPSFSLPMHDAQTDAKVTAFKCNVYNWGTIDGFRWGWRFIVGISIPKDNDDFVCITFMDAIMFRRESPPYRVQDTPFVVHWNDLFNALYDYGFFKHINPVEQFEERYFDEEGYPERYQARREALEKKRLAKRKKMGELTEEEQKQHSEILTKPPSASRPRDAEDLP